MASSKNGVRAAARSTATQSSPVVAWSQADQHSLALGLSRSVVPAAGLKSHATAVVANAREGRTAPSIMDTTTEWIRKGHLFPTSEFQRMMGWSTRRAVQDALASNRVFAMTVGAERYFPAFFADSAYPRNHLAAVSKRLGALPGGANMQFFLSRKASLNGKTVLEALAAGELEKVLRLSEAYAEG